MARPEPFGKERPAVQEMLASTLFSLLVLAEIFLPIFI
jgi:hypothetical protein